MSSNKIVPEKITNPMQLMAAWFVMLVLLVSILLGAASTISEPTWASGYLVISATILIVLVLLCVFLMLTAFRPHLQNSEEYAVWLKDQNKYGKTKFKNPETTFKPKDLDLNLGGTPEEQLSFLKKARLCNVDVVNAKDSTVIVKSLLEEGYVASLFTESATGESTHELRNSTGIWVGAELDPVIVIRAIQIAQSKWPQLLYLHLSSDSDGPEYTHEQIFIGGSHSAVERLQLQPWSTKEINEISPDISIEEFHQLIRSKYS